MDFKSFVLAILLLTAFGTKEMHHFWGHAHKMVKICDARKGEVHIHNEDYISDECPLCDFTFSIFEFHLPTFHLITPKHFFIKEAFLYKSFKLNSTCHFPSLRGPPIV